MSRAHADASEVMAYAQHLEHCVERAEPDLSKVVERGGMNIKRGSQTLLRAWSRRRYLQHYYRAISYDMDGPLAVEVGPDASKLQGKMGRGVELGSENTAPSPHLFPAWEQEIPKFEDQVARAYARALR